MGAYQGNSPFWRWLEGERGTAFPKCCGDHWIGSVWEPEPADLHWLPRADCDIFRNFASHCLKTILYLTKEIIPSQLNDGWGRAAGLSTSLSGSGVEVSKAPAPDGTGLGSTPHSTYFRWFGITFKIDPRAPEGMHVQRLFHVLEADGAHGGWKVEMAEDKPASLLGSTVSAFHLAVLAWPWPWCVCSQGENQHCCKLVLPSHVFPLLPSKHLAKNKELWTFSKLLLC